MSLDTHPYRVNIAQYSHLHGLAEEEGASVDLHGPLGLVYRRWLTRVQRHMKASGKFPHIKVNGKLDAETRAAFDKLYPKRPTFADEFRRIALHDDQHDGAEYYTQGPQRWQGVNAVHGIVEVTEDIPELEAGDCSAGLTRWQLWALQQSLGRVPRDIVNGCDWKAGFTGTIASTCLRVVTPKVGDAILYGSGTFSHVTGVYDVEQRLCISHGRAKAEIYGWDQHPNRAGFWRPSYLKA